MLSLSVLLAGCTTDNPRTGEPEWDPGATAGLVGLVLGATALAVAVENHDHDDRHDHADRREDRRHRHPPAITAIVTATTGDDGKWSL